ncbi:hypothetical protein MN608_05599 [Microdochium nivale]|nr:hypothetical protein MN608_05599 [Microdochium nivale]
MPFERLEALAGHGIPQLDGLIRRRRREPVAVVGEHNRVNKMVMPFERLEAGIPLIFHCRLRFDPARLFVSKSRPNMVPRRAKHQRRGIDLKRMVLNYPSIVHSKAVCILKKAMQIVFPN